MTGLSIATPPRSEWFPIGSIYISVNNTNPGIIFGGTWEQIKDKFLLCSGDTYGNGSTGGSATHLHETAAVALTEAQLPQHTHRGLYWMYPGLPEYVVTLNTGTYGYHLSWNGQGGSSTQGGGANEISMTVGYSGSGATHSHGNTTSTSSLPPYLVVTVWKRVA